MVSSCLPRISRNDDDGGAAVAVAVPAAVLASLLAFDAADHLLSLLCERSVLLGHRVFFFTYISYLLGVAVFSSSILSQAFCCLRCRCHVGRRR